MLNNSICYLLLFPDYSGCTQITLIQGLSFTKNISEVFGLTSLIFLFYPEFNEKSAIISYELYVSSAALHNDHHTHFLSSFHSKGYNLAQIAPGTSVVLAFPMSSYP